MNNKSITIILMILGLTLIHSDLSSTIRKSKVIKFYNFAQMMKDNKSFKIRFDGKEYESFFTNKKYVHYETTAFIGEKDINSTHQILYNTDKEFFIIYKKNSIKIRHGKIRTHLAPAFSKTYSRKSLQNTNKKREQAILNIMRINDIQNLLLHEYGLKKNKNYFASFSQESYMLPPGKNGEPKKGKNTVLIVSDKPLPNDIKVTPLYRGWTY